MRGIETIEATYQITTRMFCSGAARSRAEVRLPSLKGLLRFWWRAMCYERLGSSLTGLRKAESALFGSARAGQSRVLLRAAPPSLGQEHRGEQRAFPAGTWEGYLGYGLTDSGNRRTREFVRSGTIFKVNAISPRQLQSTQRAELRDAFKLLGLLGGMGGRARKGWGSLTLLTLSDGEETWNAPTSRAALLAMLHGFVPGRGPQRSPPPFTAFTAGVKIAVGPEHGTPEEAHRWLAERYREAVRSKGSKAEREQFGLPRPNAGKNAARRRAGPLFLHVHQAKTGPAVPVVTFFPARFLEHQPDPAGRWGCVEAFLATVEGP